MRFLDDHDLWPTIRKLARSAKRRRLVAVPYIGIGAADSILLRPNDVLICALTLANSRNGSICPAEIAKLQERGVLIYVRSELHAKVYLLGSAAIVCSANLSRMSTRLDEAGVLLRDRGQVSIIREWFDRRLNAPLTPEWLKHCDKVYRPPKVTTVPKGDRVLPTLHRLWLIGTTSIYWPDEETKAAEEGYRAARAKMRNPRKFEIEEIRWPGEARFLDPANPGDLFVEVYTQSNGRTFAYPHARLRNVKPVNSRVTYLYLERPRRFRRMAWNRFKRACAQFGLRLGKDVVVREIRDRVIADQVRALMSPERLRR